jgi:hypothetical protein
MTVYDRVKYKYQSIIVGSVVLLALHYVLEENKNFDRMPRDENRNGNIFYCRGGKMQHGFSAACPRAVS